MGLRESYEKPRLQTALVRLLAGLVVLASMVPAQETQDPSAAFARSLGEAEGQLRHGTPEGRAAAADAAKEARREARAAGVYEGPLRARCLRILWQCQSPFELGKLLDDPRFGDRAYLFGEQLQRDLVRPLLLARARRDHDEMIRLGRELGARDDAYYRFVAEALTARGRYREALVEVAKVFRKPDLSSENRAAAHDLEADCHLGLARTQPNNRDKHLEAADKALVRASDALLGVDSHRAVIGRAEIRKDQGRRLEYQKLPEEAFLKYVESIEQLERARSTSPQLFGTRQQDQDPERLAAVDGVLRIYEAAGYSITDALVLMDRLKSRDLLDWMAAPSGGQTIQGSIEMNNLLQAHPDTCFLCYWAGAERVYLLAVTAGPEGTRRLLDLGKRGEGLQLVADAHAQVSTPQGQPGPTLDRAAQFFLPAAVQPLLGAVQRVVVCPATGLGRLPWAALPFEGKPLGVSRRLVSVPSLAVLRMLSTRIPKGGGLVVLHSTTPPAPQSQFQFLNLDPLPLAEAEATLVAKHYHLLATMQGPMATFQNLRTVLESHASHVGVFHLGAHAVAHPGLPPLSLVMLGDGPLDMASLATLKLEGCVVVLSQCLSRGAADVTGLVWGPLAAGARTVVASTWQGHPQANLALMDHFHRFRARGNDDAEALRRAREQLAASEDHGHPHYWAGFAVVGPPLAPRGGGSSYWWLLAGAVLVAGIYLLRRRG